MSLSERSEQAATRTMKQVHVQNHHFCYANIEIIDHQFLSDVFTIVSPARVISQHLEGAQDLWLSSAFG